MLKKILTFFVLIMALIFLPIEATAITKGGLTAGEAGDAANIQILRSGIVQAVKDYQSLPPESSQVKKEIAGTPDVVSKQALGVASRLPGSPQQDLNNLEIYFNQENGLATFIRGDNLFAGGDTLKNAPGLFINRPVNHRDIVFKSLDFYKDLLGIRDAVSEFKIKQEINDELGLSHFKLQQVHRNIPLWGKELVVHLNKEDKVYLIEGKTVKTPGLDTTPQISAQAAEDSVIKDLGDGTRPLQTELVIFTDDRGANHLVYHVEARQGFQRWQYFIDAGNGSVVKKYNDTKIYLPMMTGQGGSRVFAAAGTDGEKVAASGADLSGKKRDFSSWKQGDSFYLIDTSLPMHKEEPNVPNSIGRGNIAVFSLKNLWGDYDTVKAKTPTGKWDPAAVSVVYNATLTYNTFREKFGRDAIDDKGSNIMTVIHLQEDNAYWDGQAMYFGDGWEYFSSLAGSLDVLAHEYTHGVTEFTANLVYENQPGALNEAMSDILACVVDDDDWTLGEGVTKVKPGFLRSMSDPHQGLEPQPASMDEYQKLPNTEDGDNGGVHVNSGIPNHAAYLMAEGLGKGKSIGRDNTGRIFYRALTHHLTMQSDFADARLATVESARELFGNGSPEVQAVEAAWDAVKVYAKGNRPGDDGNVVVDPVQGDDNLLFLSKEGDSYYLRVKPKGVGETYLVSKDPVAATRPVAVGNGEQVLFVDADNNLRVASLDLNYSDEKVIWEDGLVQSIAGSPDGRYLALTTTIENDNKVYILDMKDESGAGFREYELSFPSMDGGKNKEILYSDVIEFDMTNKHIVFDAAIQYRLNGSTEPMEYWNIGILDVETGDIHTLFPSLEEGVSVGNPATASTRDGLLALEVVDEQANQQKVVIYNTFTGNMATIIQGNILPGAFYRPVFNGDDKYLVLESNGNIVRVPLVEEGDVLTGDASAREILQNNASFPRIYRVGMQEAVPGLEVSRSEINFGRVAIGMEAGETLEIANTGSYYLEVSEFAMSATGQFDHDGLPTILAPGESMEVTVYFFPQEEGEHSAVLTIHSDDPNNTRVEIFLSGEGTSSEDLAVVGSAPRDGDINVPVNTSIEIEFNTKISSGKNYKKIRLTDSKGKKVSVKNKISGNTLTVKPAKKLKPGMEYTLSIPKNAVQDRYKNGLSEGCAISFVTAG